MNVVLSTLYVAALIFGGTFAAGYAAYTLHTVARLGWRYARWCWSK